MKANMKNKPNKWAVLIGINGYHKSLGELSYCVNDAKLMYETLVSDVCVFPRENVLLLCDDRHKEQQPTFGNIHSWLGTWLSRPSEKDLVLVYFAGHGRELSGSALLAPVDATLDSLPVTGIAIQYVRDLLERCKARQKVLILDACHSGSGRDVATMTRRFRTELDAGKGICTIASCDSDQISYEWPEKKHGVFTYYLAEAIRSTAPPDPSGLVTLDSVYDVTRRKVLDWSGGRRSKQDPVQICHVRGQIAIGKRCSAGKPLLIPPDGIQTCAESQRQAGSAEQQALLNLNATLPDKPGLLRLWSSWLSGVLSRWHFLITLAVYTLSTVMVIAAYRKAGTITGSSYGEELLFICTFFGILGAPLLGCVIYFVGRYLLNWTHPVATTLACISAGISLGIVICAAVIFWPVFLLLPLVSIIVLVPLPTANKHRR